MTTLIVKSKIWNHSNSSIINYKDKNYTKQKMTIEKSGIISLKKEKLIFRKTDNLDNSGNSSQDTNYMNESRNTELISIQKRENDSNFYVNCGDWSKDLMHLIDQNAVYFLYKGLTIENFLKEKQKYYVLSQGDIIKLGKIYLKILHIKLNGSDKSDDEQNKADKATDKHSDNNKKLVSESDSSSDDDSDNDNDSDNNKENGTENSIKNDKKEYEERSVIMKRNYSPYDSNNNSKKSEFVFNSFSNKNGNKKNKNMRYNKLSNSFNGNISDVNLDKKIKENIGIKRSMSFKLKSLKTLSISVDSSTKLDKKLKKGRNKKVKKKFNNKSKFILNKSDNNKTQQKKGKICRICFSEEDSPKKNPLICPCTCKGSMKYIHYYCLKNWLNLKIESELGYGNDIETEQPTITYSTKDISCELCKTKLPDYIKHKGQIYNVSFYKPKYNKFLVLESIRDDNRRTKFIHIIPLNHKQIVKIGRLNNCDLSLPDFSISRVHCCLYIETGQLFLENNSKFGTKILVQTPKLLMSPEYPLSIEVQKVYLKLSIQKPFSLFGCCNVYTTSVTKMLVYQKQNEKGFDLFCSMVFKEDNEENDDDNIENENNNEENESNKNDAKNLISNDSKGNEAKNNNKENNNDDKESNNNEKNKILKNYIIKNDQEKQNIINNINIGNKSKEEINKKIELNDKKFDEQEKREEEEKKENLIDDEYNNTKEDKQNLRKEKEELIDDNENNSMNDEKKSLKKEMEELIDDNNKFSEDKKRKNNLQNKEIELITKDIIKNIMNTENNKLKNKKIENKNIINNKIKIKENVNYNMNKNEDKKDIKRKSNEQKVVKVEEIKNNKEFKKEKEAKHKIEFNTKKEIKINKKEENNKENENIKNQKKINYIKTEEKPKEKEKKENKEKFERAKINYDKKEEKKSKVKEIIEKEKNINKKNDFCEKEINYSAKAKFKKQSIDLNTINDLSYKHGQEISIKNSALENYQSIYGLMSSKKNESALLLAPKYTKNKNLKNFDFNLNDEKTNDLNCSNNVWNQYTCQYEENKRMKDK